MQWSDERAKLIFAFLRQLFRSLNFVEASSRTNTRLWNKLIADVRRAETELSSTGRKSQPIVQRRSATRANEYYTAAVSEQLQ